MKNNRILLSAFLIIVFVIIILSKQNKRLNTIIENSQASVVAPNCIPTFSDGGGPYYEPDTPFRENIAPTSNKGTKLIVTGKVLLSDCTTPLTNGVVDIWQANESGSYEDEWYRGRVKTKTDGSYTFATVVPKGYGEGTAFRPPHIHFKIWKDDKLLITSQMFLPESKQQGIKDAYIMELFNNENNAITGTHNIVVP